MYEFNVGEDVEIILDSKYAVSTIGSRGVVTEVGHNNVTVKFYLLTSRHKEYLGQSFLIDKTDLKPLVARSKEEQICIKVAAMYNRQKERGIVHV